MFTYPLPFRTLDSRDSNHGSGLDLFQFVPSLVRAVFLDPQILTQSVARDLAMALADLPNPPTLRVSEIEGRVACLILIWDVADSMPTTGLERCRQVGKGRLTCRADIVELITISGRPLTAKQVVKSLRQAGKTHGTGTVAKALADLTNECQLVNRKDKKGYRLPTWIRRQKTPSLFE